MFPVLKRLSAGRAIFISLFITYAYFYQSGQHNVNAHMDQVRSLAESGSFTIDNFVYNTADAIKYGEHYYPNKAPGLSLAGTPLWLFGRLITLPFGLPQYLRVEFISYLVVVLSCGLFTALAAAVMFRVLRSVTGCTGTSMLLVVGWGLGTIAFPFATLFFSHQLTASLLIISFSLLFFLTDGNEVNAKKSQALLLLSGLMTGYAVTCEYPAVLAACAIGIYALYKLPAWRLRFVFISGGVLAGLLLLLYNYIAFGKIFFIPYSQYAAGTGFFKEHAIGFLGLKLPNFLNLLRITVLPTRGLFFVNPWLLLVVPALVAALFTKRYRSEAITSAFIVASFFSFNAGYGESIAFWGGGASVGPRHIIPMLPFAVFLIALLFSSDDRQLTANKKWSYAGWLLLVFSIVIAFYCWKRISAGGYFGLEPLALKNTFFIAAAFISFSAAVLIDRACRLFYLMLSLPVSIVLMVMATAVEPRVPYEYPNPVLDLFWDNFIHGRLALYYHGIFSSALITENSTAFNLGKLVGLPAAAQLLPLYVLWIFLFTKITTEGLPLSKKPQCSAFLFNPLNFACFFLLLAPAINSVALDAKRPAEYGLNATYIDGLIWDEPDKRYSKVDVAEDKIIKRTVDRQIIFPWSSYSDKNGRQFSVEWNGYLRIPQRALYEFELESDDGSALYIDGRLVINNWGVHQKRSRRKEVLLSAGYHPIVIRYYNAAYSGSIYFRWRRPWTHMQPVPADFLYIMR
ncbi:MAG: hypothetical protein D6719_10140 [Candidatus Dadabacteria bacterium]|nr:MAG: hypothetical protein D6719_10140 [Candidatus Dadabacteria bacterium]